MFRQKIPPLELDITASTLPQWTTGIMHWVKQSELFFGSDRKSPTSHRPVHSIKKHGARVLVLPLTSKENTSFYPLPSGIVQWVNTPEKDSYLSDHYELLPAQSVQRKAGIIPHAECINIIAWLKTRL